MNDQKLNQRSEKEFQEQDIQEIEQEIKRIRDLLEQANENSAISYEDFLETTKKLENHVKILENRAKESKNTQHNKKKKCNKPELKKIDQIKSQYHSRVDCPTSQEEMILISPMTSYEYNVNQKENSLYENSSIRTSSENLSSKPLPSAPTMPKSSSSHEIKRTSIPPTSLLKPTQDGTLNTTPKRSLSSTIPVAPTGNIPQQIPIQQTPPKPEQTKQMQMFPSPNIGNTVKPVISPTKPSLVQPNIGIINPTGMIKPPVLQVGSAPKLTPGLNLNLQINKPLMEKPNNTVPETSQAIANALTKTGVNT